MADFAAQLDDRSVELRARDGSGYVRGTWRLFVERDQGHPDCANGDYQRDDREQLPGRGRPLGR
jgi:hypothetical protein